MQKIFIAFIMLTGMSISKAQSFEYKNSGTDFILYDLSIPNQNPNIAFAGGSQYTTESAAGIIIKTEDAGESWATVYEGGNIQTLAFVSPEKGFAAGFSTTIKKTTDGGQNWEDINIGTDIYYCPSIRFYDENNGVILYATMDNDLEVRVTSDGGETWVLSPNPPFHGIMKMNYADANTLFAVGYSGSVYKSDDGGLNWNMIRQEGFGINLGVAFANDQNGVYAGEEGDLYITHDGGISWENNLNTGYHHFYGLAWKGDKVLAAGTDEDIYLSEDNGENFEIIFNGSGDDQPYEIGFFEDNSGLIVGSGGLIIKFEELFLNNKEISQNNTVIYPNPVRDAVNINSEEKIDLVQIYDLNGKVLYSQKTPGQNVQINLNSYPKGVYIIKINSKGKISTHKVSKK